MKKKKIPFGPVGYFTYKRTYARKVDPNDNNSRTEEFNETIRRVLDSCDTQLNCGFSKDERSEIEDFMLSLKGSVAGRFLWQLGTSTVDRIGLLSLQNCAVTLVNEPIRPFTWAFEALMLGCGVGYNIQKEYIYEIPKVKSAEIVRMDTKDADFIVPDSREGWVRLLENVLRAHFETGKGFSYSTICVRGKGTLIKGFGGVSSGPEELCWGIKEISNVLNQRAGKKLRPIDALDIMNIIGYVVVSGNVRRSAQIAIGDMDDPLFMNAKRWDLGSIPNWRAMSNNSVVCNDMAHLPNSFWAGYEGNGEPYGLINMKLSRKIGRLGETQYSDPKVVGYNPCVSGETQILTKVGYRRIDSMVGKKIEVWNGFEWSETTPRVTGHNQQMVKVTLSSGQSLKCTEAHVFHIATDYLGNSKAVNAVDLNPGMKLIKTNMPVIEEGEYCEDAYTQGFISGDGMDGYNCLWLYEPKYMCENRLSGKSSSEYGGIRKQFKLTRTYEPKSFVPMNWNIQSRLNWFAGLIDSDGTELKEGGAQISSVDKEFLLKTQKMLTTLGVTSKVTKNKDAGVKLMPDGRGGQKEYSCQEVYRLLIGSVQMQDLKQLGLKCERMAFDKKPQRDASQFVKIVNVEPAGIEETVYCFTESKRNLGCFEGIVTGQCSEQSLADKETCCLAEIFLPNIVSKDELKKVVTYLYRICKHSLALKCHLKDTEDIVHENMRMGIGITGYLQASEEQKSWLSETYDYLRSFDKKYSKEHGWPTSVKLTTSKPSGTLSLLPGVTPGVHPGYSRYFIRRIRVASNSPLADLCRNGGYDVEFQRNFDGSDDKNTVVVSFPCSYPEGTVVAGDVSAIQQLEYVVRMQKEWSDNGVSCTVYYKKEELPGIKDWLKKNYNTSLKSVSFLLHSEHGFAQAPYEEISEESFNAMSAKVKPFDSVEISFDDISDSLECVSGSCPIR